MHASIESPSPGANESRWQMLWYAGLALAALVRVGLIDRHGLANNDFITLRVMDLSFGEVVTERLSRNHMPLYFLLEKAWVGVFGTSEGSMRAIAAFFGWMAVWATGRLGDWGGSWEASDWASWWSLQRRSISSGSRRASKRGCIRC